MLNSECVLNFPTWSSLRHLRQPLHQDPSAFCRVVLGGKCAQAGMERDRLGPMENIGRFPFTKRFRKFRLGFKWNLIIFRFVSLENFRKKWNFWKGSPGAFTIWMEFSVAPSGQMELHFSSTKETKWIEPYHLIGIFRWQWAGVWVHIMSTRNMVAELPVVLDVSSDGVGNFFIWLLQHPHFVRETSNQHPHFFPRCSSGGSTLKFWIMQVRPRSHYAGGIWKRWFHSENASNVFGPH